jgi:hypothetical protein
MTEETQLKTLLRLAFAASMIATIWTARPMAASAADPGQIILVSGGCGSAYHRDYYGYCRPNYYRVWRACPLGYHLGYGGQRCWPN